MKQMRAVLLVAAAFSMGGCIEPVQGNVPVVFSYTQEAVCTGVIDREDYGFFDWAEDTGMVIPGLRQNFIPQGVACWSARNWLLISGYFMPVSGSSAAAVLAVDLGSGKLAGEYTLVDGLGREVGGHFSGIAVTDTDLYVTGPYCLYRIPLMELLRVGEQGALSVKQELPVSATPSACNYSDGILWVCEHYQPNAFPLKGEHVSVCNDGNTHHAWMVGYKITRKGTLKPYCVFSVPDRIQGITVLADGRILLSQSYGRTNPSRVLVCRDPRQNTPDAYADVEGHTVPLWHLDSVNGKQSICAPPMAEGCCAVGNSVYLIFESGAYYYRAYAPDNPSLDPTDKIWKLTLPENN